MEELYAYFGDHSRQKIAEALSKQLAEASQNDVTEKGGKLKKKEKLRSVFTKPLRNGEPAKATVMEIRLDGNKKLVKTKSRKYAT